MSNRIDMFTSSCDQVVSLGVYLLVALLMVLYTSLLIGSNEYLYSNPVSHSANVTF